MFDVAVVGGGIVGLATARELLSRNPRRSVLVLEKERELAAHQSGHNSGVIHSGIYYRPGSLKARNCRRGVTKLIAFCDAHDVPYELCGKVVVASSEQERPRLQALFARGRANGVGGLRLVTRDELKEIEPHAEGVEALVSAETGIVDFRAVAEKLGEVFRNEGGHIETGARVLSLESSTLVTTTGDFEAKRVVCCAGLHADRVATLMGARPSILVLGFRGEYYRLRPESRHLVRHLIYPVPNPRFPFLGVHFTRRITGEIDAGPNAVLAFAREGYEKSNIDWRDVKEMLGFGGFWRMGAKHWSMAVDEYRRSISKRAFVNSLKRLVPEITAADLETGGAGVRAVALGRDGELIDDFRIERSGNVVNVLNAPSPAATSALAIAENVADMLE
jgi:L-2-hydroxyglutarate oxidase LhgO